MQVQFEVNILLFSIYRMKTEYVVPYKTLRNCIMEPVKNIKLILKLKTLHLSRKMLLILGSLILTVAEKITYNYVFQVGQ